VCPEIPKNRGQTGFFKDKGARRKTGGKTLESGKKPKKTGLFYGASNRVRTDDLLITNVKQALLQNQRNAQ
jgi:hypothetical protein